jgi:hypothetical protein
MKIRELIVALEALAKEHGDAVAVFCLEADVTPREPDPEDDFHFRTDDGKRGVGISL